MSRTPGAQQCLAQLGQTGARFSPLPDKLSPDRCNLRNTVEFTALRGDLANFSVSNLGPVACPVATTFAAWARFGVDRAARQILGSPLAQIETMGSFACRNVAGSSRRSAHSTAEAIDVGGFVLEDGRRISVLRHWDDGTQAEREFLRTVHRSACRRFGTVLSPDYDSAHRDHFHLESTIGGRRNFCR
ncbi:extensin family protein [Alteripontixanthobacter maritimus]|nr:extensin family protein [Alteripontixanthobacter maritimus]